VLVIYFSLYIFVCLRYKCVFIYICVLEVSVSSHVFVC
jgi:hypothetical protein